MDKFSKALEHLKKKELARARIILEQLVREEPKRGEALYNLGMIYTDMGEPEKAVGTLSKLLAFEECGANVYVALGFAYSRMKDHDQAKKMFLIALKIEPDNPYAHKNIGALYGNEKNYEKAIQHFEEAFKANPEDLNTAYGLGVTYFNTGDVVKADHYLRKTIELEPASSLSEMAKDLLREIAALNLKGKGFRTDAMFYCLHAISFFEKVGPAETQKIAFEIALKGREGLDSFGKPDTLSKVFKKLVQSYALDAIDFLEPDKEIKVSRTGVSDLIQSARSAGLETRPSVGLGTDLRLDSREVTGFALALDGQVVHLSVFDRPRNEQEGHRFSRMGSFSNRRRNRE